MSAVLGQFQRHQKIGQTYGEDMNSRCQICGIETFDWTIKQAIINVGTIRDYKIQACEDCTRKIEEAIIPVIAIRKSK